jgi:hypothetical protein
MEYRMNSHLLGKLQSIRQFAVSYRLDNFEGTKSLDVEL